VLPLSSVQMADGIRKDLLLPERQNAIPDTCNRYLRGSGEACGRRSRSVSPSIATSVQRLSSTHT